MPPHQRTTETGQPNKQPKEKLPFTEPLATPQAGIDGLFDGRAIQTEADSLAKVPWQQAQRHALAARIGQTHGNSHLQRVLNPQPASGLSIQRQVPAPAPGQAPPPAPAPADPNAALPQFSFKQKTISFSGGHGDFDATYTPVAPVPSLGTLDIVLRILIDYKDFDPDMALKEPFKTYFKEHPMTKAQKGDFKWTEDEKKEKGAKFKADFQSSVGGDWSDKYKFHLKKTDFAEYRAKVQVKVEIMEDGSKGQPHVHLYIQKVPKGVEARFRSFVGQEPDPNDSETDPAKKSQRKMAVLDYRDPSAPEKHSIQPMRFVGQIKPFGFDNAELTGDLGAQVDAFNRQVQPHKADLQSGDWFVSVVGRASAKGSQTYNEKLGERRANAVYDRLDQDIRKEAAIGSEGEKNASEDEAFQRVDVAMINIKKREEVTQNVASHEAGHMFGLGDEYEDEKPGMDALPKFQGDRPTHYDKVEELMGEEAAKDLAVQNSGSMMSSGGEVKRGHYVHFLEAINSVTGQSWAVE